VGNAVAYFFCTWGNIPTRSVSEEESHLEFADSSSLTLRVGMESPLRRCPPGGWSYADRNIKSRKRVDHRAVL